MFGRMMVSALALMGGVAYAQEPATPPPTTETNATPPPASTADRTVYEAAFFAQYNPQTASDMVAQVPGFTLSNGDGRRGFSGAVGNLLIDGIRPTSKSQGVNGILSRIPANQVLRIEVLRGAAVAGDASGQSTLINIVRTPNAGSGTWSTGFEYTSRQVAAPRAEASYSGRNGQVEWGVGGSIFSQYRDLPGWRNVFSEPSNTFVSDVDTPSPRDFREVALNGNLAFPLFGGRLSSTAQLDWWRFHSVSNYYFRDPATNDLQRHFDSHFKEGQRQPNFEIGLNYDRDIGPWTLGLVGLVHRDYYGSDEVDADDVFIGPPSPGHTDIAQTVDRDTGETILRGSLARSFGDHRVEFGGEGAYNSLDQSLVFSVNGTAIPIGNSNVLVEENRAEFFVVDTWRPNDRWTLESRLAWETSTLTFTGDTNDEVPLDYWKPSIQLSRNIGESNQAHVRVYRDIGQLNFDDFVSAAAIADQLIAGGNPELVPQTQWIAELGIDWHFGAAALSATLAQHWISDAADVVPLSFTVPCAPTPSPGCGVPQHFDGPGNIGDATATSLDVNYSTPLNWLLPGARVNVIGYWWDTDVVDPLTGQHRILSNRPETQLEVDFRQDIHTWKVAWGINFFKQGEQQAYRFNEIDTSEEGPWVDFFVETTALPNNMKLRLWAANFMNGEVHRDRRFFNQDDGFGSSLGRNGINTSRDLRQRIFSEAPWLIVELSGTF